MKKACFIILVISLLTGSITAQDVEALLKAPITTINGGVSMNHIFTLTPGDSTKSNLYSMYLVGNLNLNFFGVVNIPLSFAYTNQQLSKNVSLPFNRFSIAPSYKWIKIYAGYASMQFSPYSLAGHEIFGGGVELTPDNGWKISAIFGRMKKASTGDDGLDPAYHRLGGGVKVEYTGTKFGAGVNIFKAQDLVASLPDTLPVTPQDNLTGSINLNLNMIKNLQWGVEYGFSILNRNIRQNNDDGQGFRLLHTQGILSTYHALKTNLMYTSPVGAIGATYERVAPDYMTLGAYYMTNDYENITGNFSTTIKSVSAAFNIGYQRDNLSDTKNNTTSRMIYSGNASANLGKKWTLGANFSNVQSFMYINDVYKQASQTNEFQNLDTLNVTQLNLSAALNAAYLLQNTKERRQGVNLNVSYQQSAEKQEYSNYTGNDIYNASLSYQFSIIPVNFNASAAVNCNYNQMPDNSILAMSYNLSLQKTMMENLRTALTCTYSHLSNNVQRLSNVLNLRISGGYIFFKHHNINLNLAMIHSNSPTRTQLQYSINLAYSYVFTASLARKDKRLKLSADF
jgi:hypothetical protein